MSITELRALIHEAGLSSRDLLERKEFLQRAKEAKKILRRNLNLSLYYTILYTVLYYKIILYCYILLY